MYYRPKGPKVNKKSVARQNKIGNNMVYTLKGLID